MLTTADKGTNVCFMLDTGTSVSLLKNDVWRHVTGDSGLSAWSSHKLVSMEGSPISILALPI